MSAELVENKESFSMMLSNSLTDVQDALPRDFNKTRFVQNAVALLNENETLQNFAKQYGTSQIKVGMLKAAYLGLDFMSKEAYLIPYKNQLQFMIDYRGNVKLCKKYSMRSIKDIYAKLVRDGDTFEEAVIDGHPSISYRAVPFSNAPVIGAFAVCLFQDGGMIYETMSLEDLETARRQSKASNSPAWTKFTGEMYKKTVLHRLCKHIEIDLENPEQYRYIDEDMELADVKSQVKNNIESDNASEEFVVDTTFNEV